MQNLLLAMTIIGIVVYVVACEALTGDGDIIGSAPMWVHRSIAAVDV